MNLTTAPTGGGRRTVRRAAALASTLLLAAGGLAVSAAAPASAAPTSFPATSGVPAFIGDYTTSNAGIPVSSATSSAITAQITLNHSCVADLVISLIAPDGTTAVLADENRTCRGLNGTYTFSDSGADSFLSAPTTSSYEIPVGSTVPPIPEESWTWRRHSRESTLMVSGPSVSLTRPAWTLAP